MALFVEESSVSSIGKRSSRLSPSFVISMCCLIMLACVNLATAETSQSSVVVEGQDVRQHSPQDEALVVSKDAKHPSTLQDLFSRLQRSNSRNTGNGLQSTDGAKTCFIEVQVVTRVAGRCIRLLGGGRACHTDEYLDPMNSDCH